MLIALIAHDKPGSIEIRKANRDAHIAHLDSFSSVHFAGPLLDSDGEMCGSLIVLDVADMSAAEDFAARDPYAKAGLFESVMLREWKKVRG